MFRNSISLKASSFMLLKSASFSFSFTSALVILIKAMRRLSEIYLFWEAKMTKRFRIE